VEIGLTCAESGLYALAGSRSGGWFHAMLSTGHELFRTRDVVEILGISRRQLQYWARTDLVAPSSQTPGGHGRYTFQDLVALKAAKRLIDAGVSVQRIRRSMRALQRILPTVRRPLAEMVLVMWCWHSGTAPPSMRCPARSGSSRSRTSGARSRSGDAPIRCRDPAGGRGRTLGPRPDAAPRDVAALPGILVRGLRIVAPAQEARPGGPTERPPGAREGGGNPCE
jgi:hypothetical protein